MEEGKLIEVRFRDKLLPIAEKKTTFCSHRSVEVDPDSRILSCVKCGLPIDPFNYVLQLANKERSIHQWIEMLEKERKILFDEKEKLKQQVSYLKTQLKKLNK